MTLLLSSQGQSAEVSACVGVFVLLLAQQNHNTTALHQGKAAGYITVVTIQCRLTVNPALMFLLKIRHK